MLRIPDTPPGLRRSPTIEGRQPHTGHYLNQGILGIGPSCTDVFISTHLSHRSHIYTFEGNF